jgi:p-hydroxybenzoic acid efflux pump subunit AaeB
MSVRYHYNLIYNDLNTLVKIFSWNSLQTRLAIKTAIACTLAVAVTDALELGFPFWAGISALVMMRADVGASFAKGWMRSLGCTIGCILTLFFLGFCIQNPILFSLFIIAGIFIGFYLGFQAKYGYFWLYMLANMVLMGMVALSDPYGTFPLHIVYYRAADIFIGVMASWFINIILWPHYAGDELVVSSKQLLSKTAILVKECLLQYTENKYNEIKFNTLYNDVLVLLKKNNGLVGSAKLEKKIFKNHRVEFETMFQILDYKIKNLRIIYKQILAQKKSDYSKNYLDLLYLIISNFNDLSNKKFYDDNRKIKRLLVSIQLNFNKIKISYNKNSAYSKSFSVEEIMIFHEMIYFLESFYNDFTYVLRNSFKYKNEAPGYKKIDSDKADYFMLKFLSYELPIYIPVAIHATKATLGVLFTFWFCLWLQIPGGLLNMSVAIIAVFASQTDIITSNHKGILRLLGCLIGGAVGLFILQFGIESSFAIFSIILGVTFFTSYLFTARPGIAYIGLQAGIAFLMCVAGSFTVVTSFQPVIERLLGVILAILCM